jgi:hypothetical protein
MAIRLATARREAAEELLFKRVGCFMVKLVFDDWRIDLQIVGDGEILTGQGLPWRCQRSRIE